MDAPVANASASALATRRPPPPATSEKTQSYMFRSMFPLPFREFIVEQQNTRNNIGTPICERQSKPCASPSRSCFTTCRPKSSREKNTPHIKECLSATTKSSRKQQSRMTLIIYHIKAQPAPPYLSLPNITKPLQGCIPGCYTWHVSRQSLRENVPCILPVSTPVLASELFFWQLSRVRRTETSREGIVLGVRATEAIHACACHEQCCSSCKA